MSEEKYALVDEAGARYILEKFKGDWYLIETYPNSWQNFEKVNLITDEGNAARLARNGDKNILKNPESNFRMKHEPKRNYVILCKDKFTKPLVTIEVIRMVA